MDCQNTWSIGMLAREFGITPRALRFYEDKGLLYPSRDSGNRIYTYRDRARLDLILRGKRLGFSLNDIREMLDLYDYDDNQRIQMRASLTKFEQQVKVLETQREDIDHAMEELHRGIEWMKEKLSQIPVETEKSEVDSYCATAKAHLQDDAFS